MRDIILLPDNFIEGTADITVEPGVSICIQDLAPEVMEDYKRTGKLFIKHDGEALMFEFGFFNFSIPFEQWVEYDKQHYIWLMQMLKEGRFIDKEPFTSGV